MNSYRRGQQRAKLEALKQLAEKRAKTQARAAEVTNQINEVADRAVERLGYILQSQGAEEQDILAFEQAVEGRLALQVLHVTYDQILTHGGSPQQAIFDHLAGSEDEGMGLAAIAHHLEIGIPEDD